MLDGMWSRCRMRSRYSVFAMMQPTRSSDVPGRPVCKEQSECVCSGSMFTCVRRYTASENTRGSDRAAEPKIKGMASLQRLGRGFLYMPSESLAIPSDPQRSNTQCCHLLARWHDRSDGQAVPRNGETGDKGFAW